MKSIPNNIFKEEDVRKIMESFYGYSKKNKTKSIPGNYIEWNLLSKLINKK